MDKGPKFEALKRKWYAKLKRSGFEDIEQDEVYLKKYTGQVSGVDGTGVVKNGGYYEIGLPPGSITWDFAKQDGIRPEALAEYYRWATHQLNEFKFKTKKDYKIWKLHTEGLSIRQIARACKMSYHNKIHSTIQRLVKSMKCQKPTK